MSPICFKETLASAFHIMLSSLFAAASTFAVTKLAFFLDFLPKLFELATLKYFRDIARDGLYRSAGNDITSYFQSAADRVNVPILSHVQVGSTHFQKLTVLEKVIQVLSFLLCESLDVFAPRPRKWGPGGPTVVNESHKLLRLATSKFTIL